MGNKAIKATIGGKVDNKNINLLDKFFEIPAYQRLYEWESTQIEELLNDIKKAWEPYILQDSKSSEDLHKSIKPYFIGNITTSAKSNKGEHDKTNDKQNKIYVLIDGQQRLTTLWFIGFYLASRDCGEWQQKWKEFILQNNKLRIAMPIRDKEREALESLAKKIQKHNKEEKLEFSKDLQGIHQKIINAFDFIESWFVGENCKDINLTKFAECIFKKVCFVFVKLAQNTDLNRFFVRMNNRGKQLEKHEIFKARILSVIQKGGGEWQKYAKIWDLCSDINKYIFQSANDRKALNSVSDDNEGWNIDRIIKEFNDKNTKNKDNDDTPDKVESIIDFPTFLLHCYKLWVAKKCSDKIEKITITKDNLLEIMWDNQTNNGKNKEVILDDTFIFNIKNDTNGQAKANCKEFIESMLSYRVMFDYFVIKSDVMAKGGNSYKIMRLSENQGNYNLSENSKKGELTSGVLHDLVMIQNYLLVARQGDRQNYHHWLTPFLAYLDTKKDTILVLKGGNALDLDFAKWKIEKEGNDTAECECKTNTIAKRFSESNDENWQNDLITYLSKLDTALSKEQLGTNGENKLLPIANEAIQATFKAKSLNDIKWNLKSITDKWEQYATKDKDNYKEWAFLNKGTGTPHYWFYRLEYYLWKWGKLNDEDFGAQCKEKFGDKFDDLKSMFNAKLGTQHNFKSIAKNFYFRNLNSVEHFHPQHLKKQNGWDTHIDYFGNLALISSSTNSQYSDQLPKEKKEDLKNKLNKKGGNTESLKFFLMCAQCEYDKDEWDYKKNVENKHEKYMLNILKESFGLNPKDSSDSKEN